MAVLDADGRALPGFSREDCDPVDLNQIDHTVRWRGEKDAGATAGKPIRLEFTIHRSKLFTFRFAAAEDV